MRRSAAHFARLRRQLIGRAAQRQQYHGASGAGSTTQLQLDGAPRTCACSRVVIIAKKKRRGRAKYGRNIGAHADAASVSDPICPRLPRANLTGRVFVVSPILARVNSTGDRIFTRNGASPRGASRHGYRRALDTGVSAARGPKG